MSGVNPLSVPSYEMHILKQEELDQITVASSACYATNDIECGQALILAEREYKRCTSNIGQLAIKVEKCVQEITTLKENLIKLKSSMEWTETILDTEKNLAHLIENLSGPVALFGYGLSVTPMGAAAVGTGIVLMRLFGKSVSTIIEKKVEKKTEEKEETDSSLSTGNDFTFRNINSKWYKKLVASMQEEQNIKITPMLLRAIDFNDMIEYDLDVVSSLYAGALIEGKKEEAQLLKDLHDRKIIPVLAKTTDELLSTLGNMPSKTGGWLASWYSSAKPTPSTDPAKSGEQEATQPVPITNSNNPAADK